MRYAFWFVCSLVNNLMYFGWSDCHGRPHDPPSNKKEHFLVCGLKCTRFYVWWGVFRFEVYTLFHLIRCLKGLNCAHPGSPVDVLLSEASEALLSTFTFFTCKGQCKYADCAKWNRMHTHIFPIWTMTLNIGYTAKPHYNEFNKSWK